MSGYETALKDAWAVQDACNLSGVVRAWARHQDSICERNRNGTDDRNADPVNVLFASKVASLTRCEQGSVFGAAYDVAKPSADGIEG